MRLKTTLAREPKHSATVTSIVWLNSEELLSVSDDHQILRWDLQSGEAHSFCSLPQSIYPTDIHWLPKGQHKAGGDSFVLASTDGRFYLISKTGRVEKSVEAHKGAALSTRWSNDGNSFLTVGEDGSVNVWSRSGLLRNILSQSANAVVAGCWSLDDRRVLFCCGRKIVVEPIQSIGTGGGCSWTAHDGTVLAIDWSRTVHECIVSGGEDCRYKVWDSFGRPLYSSSILDFPITSVSWSPEGNLFAVGSYNSLGLCDKAGWSHSLERPRTGSIFNIRWSPDGTQLAGACANAQVLHGSIVEQRVEWRHLEAIQTKRKTVQVRDVTTDGREKLEVKDRVTKLALAWGRLVIATVTQCLVYNSTNWNTPIIFELKNGGVSLIVMAPKLFLLIDGISVLIRNYDGRLQCQLKIPANRANSIIAKTVALSNDTVAIRDGTDDKTVLLFDTDQGKPTGSGKIVHTQEIIGLAIDQCGGLQQRKIAFIDRNNDCFIASIHSYGSNKNAVKIGTMIQQVCFHDQTNMLAGVQDRSLLIWLCPLAALVDIDLVSKTIQEERLDDSSGRAPTLVSFVGSHVTIRRQNGTIVNSVLSPFVAVLHSHLDNSNWDRALALCRHVKDHKLWATLAAMAVHARNLTIAEIAYGAIDEAEKVHFFVEIRSNPNKDVRNAEMAIFCGNTIEAEGLLLQSGHVFRAIMLNIMLYQWERALDLAIKHKAHVDTVLGFRQRYLEDFDRIETNEKFLHHVSQIEVDWDHIEEIIEEEYQKEKVK